MLARGRKGRISNQLVATSCAAILAVYAAGYSRTRGEARRLESEGQMRRPVRSGPRAPEPAVSTSIAVAPPAVPAPVVLPEASEPELVAPKNSPRVEAAPAVAAVEQPEPATTVPVSAAAEEKAASEPAALPVAEVAAGDAEPAAPAHKPWFDGYYTGWGQSRHGDIQAYVTIKEGRIVDAGIATCETRYPCSVIDDIILQPINLQGPDVDRVSRATESADAYYTGLVRALEGAETGTFRSPRP